MLLLSSPFPLVLQCGERARGFERASHITAADTPSALPTNLRLLPLGVLLSGNYSLHVRAPPPHSDRGTPRLPFVVRAADLALCLVCDARLADCSALTSHFTL